MQKKKDLRIGGIIILVIAIVVVGYGVVKTVLEVIDMNTGDYVTEKVFCSKSKIKTFLEERLYMTRNVV